MKMNKTAIIYARVSSVRQADDGLPIESQVDQATRKAESLDAEVVKTFIDAGISGRTDERPAFQDAILYCKTFEVDYFICWSTSRFARNKVDASLYKRDLEKGGTRVVYVSVDLDNTTDSGWMMESMLEIFDEHYSRQVSTDTRRSMIKNAHDGGFNGGRPPFGYLVVPFGKRKKLAINDVEADVVRTIFQLYLAGSGTKNIAVELNRKQLSLRGAVWSKGNITNLLKNEVYLGRIIFSRTRNRIERPRSEWIIVQSHEPIINEGDFMKVQSIFEGRYTERPSGSPASNHLFTGMMFCEKCGSTMQIETATGRSKTYSYYNCRGFLKGSKCSARRVPCAEFDNFLLGNILTRVITKESMLEIINEIREMAGSWLKERQIKRDTTVTALRSVEKKLKNLYGILELHGVDAPNLGDLTLRLRELKVHRDELDRELIKIESEAAPQVVISDAELNQMASVFRDTMMNPGDPKKTRSVLSSFINKIELGSTQVKVSYNPDKLMNRALGTVHSEDIWLPDVHPLRTNFIVLELPDRFVKRAA